MLAPHTTLPEPCGRLAALQALNAIHAAPGEAELAARLTGAAMSLTGARRVEIDDGTADVAALLLPPDPPHEITVPLTDAQGRRHGRLVVRTDADAPFDADASAVLAELARAAASVLTRLRPVAGIGDGPSIDTLNDLAQRLAQVGGWSVDVQRRRAYWTDQKAAIHGLPKGTWLDLDDAVGMFAPEQREAIASAYERCARDGTPYDLEAELLTPQGQRRWVRTIAVAERDAKGRIVRVNGAFQDIGRIKEAEDRFRFIAKATTDTVWDWDLVADRFWWGAADGGLFGESCGSGWSGTDAWTGRMHPDDRARVLEGLQQALNSRQDNWQDDYRFRLPDGSYSLVADRGYVFFGPEGRPVRMVGGMRDVTETRRLEARLQQAQRLEAIGQLTGGVAHDFNNLLTVILGNAEALEEGFGPDEGRQRRLAEMLHQAAARGADLTRRLLAVARRQPLQPRAIDLHGLLAEMRPLLQQAVGDRIVLRLAPAGDSAQVRADGPQLEAAILNLALNARDAMPDGGRLTIAVRAVDLADGAGAGQNILAPGGYVLLEIQDEGTGMTDEVLSRAFEPFFTTKDAARGSGLGLSTVYGFARQSGGTVRLSSAPGEGTVVRLYLPAADEPAAVPAPAAVQAPAGRGEKVLMVEDDDLVRNHVGVLLAGLGYRVLSAGSGAAGLRQIQAEPGIDLLFTDVRMPGGLDGIQLAARARLVRPGLKVLFTSGHVDDPAVQDEVDLLSKPYRRSDLALALRRVLDRDGRDL